MEEETDWLLMFFCYHGCCPAQLLQYMMCDIVWQVATILSVEYSPVIYTLCG